MEVGDIPLYSVVRPRLAAAPDNPETQRIHNARQNGAEWRKDNKRVGLYLSSFVKKRCLGMGEGSREVFIL